jgi:hypothetical protein
MHGTPVCMQRTRKPLANFLERTCGPALRRSGTKTTPGAEDCGFESHRGVIFFREKHSNDAVKTRPIMHELLVRLSRNQDIVPKLI